MNIWLHRISHYYEVAKPMLEQNYLTIGFSDYVKIFTKYELKKVREFKKWQDFALILGIDYIF